MDPPGAFKVLVDYPWDEPFLAEPRKQELEVLLEWMVAAGEANVSVAFDDRTAKVLRTLGQPLELVNLGQTKASLRLDSRFVKDVVQRADQDSVPWAPIAEHLRDAYGLQPIVVDLFLCFLCQRDHRALTEAGGEPVEVKLGMPPASRLRLQRGTVVAAADWHRLRDLGEHLFAEERPPAHRSLQAQDRFAGKLREHGQRKRVVLQGLHQRLVHLGVDEGSGRLAELAAANARLSPLAQTTTDSYKVLTELLASWPDDAMEPLASLVRQAEPMRDALAELSETARQHLEAGRGHPARGADVREQLARLRGAWRRRRRRSR